MKNTNNDINNIKIWGEKRETIQVILSFNVELKLLLLLFSVSNLS